jgi:hypothetical protein
MDESALRTLIANLEASRSSNHWWLEFCTALVAIGVLFEVIFVIWEYVDELHDFRRGIVHPPERPNMLLFALGLLGAGLVAIGVAGEFRFEAKIESTETSIRKANDDLFLLLSKEAGDANASAANAEASAKAADKAASNAQDRVRAVAKNAEDIDRDLEMTQLLVSARHVEDIKTLTEQLRQFKGQTVDLGSRSDSEEYGLCFVLKSIAHDAGMNPIDHCGLEEFVGAPPTGISIRGPDDNAVLSMAEMIGRTGKLMVQSGPFGNAPKPSTFVILVGPKPPFEIGQARGVKGPKTKAQSQKSTKR